MATPSRSLQAFLNAADDVAFVEVIETKGSAPREQGAWMLVSRDAIHGTIGGGHLEYLAIEKARNLLTVNATGDLLDLPLGPEIGQCCGGRVVLSIRPIDRDQCDEFLARISHEEVNRPNIFIFGGGHVGRALAASLVLLPVNVTVVETRADALLDMPDDVATRLVAMPEQVVREAPAQSSFLILTHDHALDFLIVSDALKRTDVAYVGMIGSKTKRATFKSWYLREANGDEDEFSRLVCPIGGSDVKDKRPEVIAALAAAEVIRNILTK